MKCNAFVRYATLLVMVIGIASMASAQTYVLDHFRCYPFTPQPQPGTSAMVWLFDPLTALSNLTLSVIPYEFCNRVQKTVNGLVTPVVNANHHFVMYSIVTPATISLPRATINNQFGDQAIALHGGATMLVPAGQGQPTPPPSADLDHYECYFVDTPPPLNIQVTLLDDFTSDTVTVLSAAYFCNPVVKTHGSTQTIIQHPLVHLACYWTSPSAFPGRTIDTLDQFSPLTIPVKSPDLLCVPSSVKTWINNTNQ